MNLLGVSARKLQRKRDQRRALVKNLATAIVEYESIETTLPKAKTVVPYVERLITKAKKGDLHSRRQIIASLDTPDAAHRLVDEIAPKLSHRTSGHLRIERTAKRLGDNASIVTISFVDDLSKSATPQKTSNTPTDDVKPKVTTSTKQMPEKSKSSTPKDKKTKESAS